MTLGGLFGERNANEALRSAPVSTYFPTNIVQFDDEKVTIPAGQSAVILTDINFSWAPDTLVEFRKSRESADALRSALGTRGFTGNVGAYGVPEPKDYTYGPTIVVTGALVNSTRVDFVEHPLPNFLELTAASEVGSCPYLLSWDDGDREWITHGKILHNGQGKAKAYTETITFSGLRTHFRIEEREPEIAHLQDPKLIVEFKDGSAQTFSPIHTATSIKGSAEITLLWGEAADISFLIPGEMVGIGVVETRLEVNGYYERYANLLAEQEWRSRATPLPIRVNSPSAHTTAIAP
jgi:hypothetical protein